MTIAFLDRIAPQLDRVATVAPIARRVADWSEANSRPADELIEALRDADLFRLLVPRELGGAGLSPWMIGPILEEMAWADGSAGWTLALAQGLLGQLVKRELFEELFADPRLTMAGSLNPAHVRAERIDGGFRFSGRGTYVSGCTHAAWMVASGFVVVNGRPALANDAPVVKAGVLPMSACRIRETWKMVGMRGTGSHDVEFEDVFVREDLTFGQTDALANLGASLAPVALGIARHAIDAFVELACRKVPTASRSLLRERVTAQSALAEAQGYLQAARSSFYETVAEAETRPTAGRAPTSEERARLRLDDRSATRRESGRPRLRFCRAHCGLARLSHRSMLARHPRRTPTHHAGNDPATRSSAAFISQCRGGRR